MPCKVVNAAEVSAPFREELTKRITELKTVNIQPKLVGFLANDDPAAAKYAEWTAKTCLETGMDFELRKVDGEHLDEALRAANEDAAVHGIMIYYPVFGGDRDQYLQNSVKPLKDVEGLCHQWRYNMFHNVRFIDDAKTQKCIIPCTPLAVVKILEHIGAYNRILPYGDRLHGRVITIINRSEIVGRPLAAMLSNDGAKVFSVDIENTVEFTRGAGIHLEKHEVKETTLTVEQVLPLSDVVITGVPVKGYKVPTHLLKEGVIAINFATFKNFEDDVKSRAAIFVPSVGKVTVAMLERNLVRLCEYANDKPSS